MERKAGLVLGSLSCLYERIGSPSVAEEVGAGDIIVLSERVMVGGEERKKEKEALQERKVTPLAGMSELNDLPFPPSKAQPTF